MQDAPPKQPMERQMALTPRIGWIDVARGIGIILVVYGHVLIGLSVAHPLSPGGLLSASEYTIYTFHMPLFFVLAGLNVTASMAKGRLRFLRNKIWTIVYPYILWSLFQGSIQVLFPHMVNAPHSAKSLITILWRPIGQFWFLYVLFVCHLFAFVCRANRVLLVSLAIALLLADRWHPNDLLKSVAIMFSFYVGSILLCGWLLRWRPKLSVALVLSLLLAGFLLVAAKFGFKLSSDHPYALASLPASVAGIGLVISLSHLIEGVSHWLSRQFERLGQISLTIYILHVLAAAGARVVLMALGVKGLAELLILCTAAGIFIPFAIHLLLEHFHLLAAFGLGVPPGKHSAAPEQNAPILAARL